MEPRVFAHSQTHRLRERMAEAAVGHGQEVRADLPGIRVTAESNWRGAAAPNAGVVFFCNMGSIRVREVLDPGDGGALPSEVILEGISVPEPGTYDILNALVLSNGALRLRADAGTRVVQRARAILDAWV